jgi:hypothetical protein
MTHTNMYTWGRSGNSYSRAAQVDGMLRMLAPDSTLPQHFASVLHLHRWVAVCTMM